MILVLLLCVSVLALGVTAQSRIKLKHTLSCKEVENLALASEAQYYREQVERVTRPIEGPFRGFVLLPPAEVQGTIGNPEPEPEVLPTSLTTLTTSRIATMEWVAAREKEMARWRAAYKDYERVSDLYIQHLLEYPQNRALQEEILGQMTVVGARLAEMDKRLEAAGISFDDLLQSLSS